MSEKMNPLEEDTVWMAEEYTKLVYEMLDELAPYRPWWSQDLTPDEMLWRWQEVREPIMDWLVEVGVYMGFKSYEELLDNLEKVWMTNLLVDAVPPEVIDRLPVQLIELVQAGPYEAAAHIKKAERLYARRLEVARLFPNPNGPPPPPAPGEEAELPEIPTPA